MIQPELEDIPTTPDELREITNNATHMLWNRVAQLHDHCETIFYTDKREIGDAIIPDLVFQQLKYDGVHTFSPIESFNWYCMDREHNRDVITEHERRA